MMEPHTAAELSLDDIIKMTDELLEAHKRFLPAYR
jgi:alpha-galactosidase